MTTPKRAIIIAAALGVAATVLVVAVLYFALGKGANDDAAEIGGFAEASEAGAAANDNAAEAGATGVADSTATGAAQTPDANAAGTDGAGQEGPGYASPEDAARAYLEAFRDADVEAMISTFAIESYVENYDFEASIERLRVYVITHQQSFPSNNKFTTGLNIERRRSQIADSIRLQYMSLFIPEAINGGRSTSLTDEQETRGFIASLGNLAYFKSMQTMEIVGFVTPESLSDSYTSESNQRIIDANMEIIGAQGLENVVARVEIDGQTYIFCFDAAEYGGKWYIHTLGGNIAMLLGMSAYDYGVANVEAYLP